MNQKPRALIEVDRSGPSLKLDPQASLPIYAQIRQQLAWLIASGTLKAGARLPSIRELARHHKINLHTVRQAYHALEADGLLETRPGRGTHVLPVDLEKLIAAAAALPSHTVGVLLPNLTPFYAPFLLGLEEAAKSRGYLLITCFTHDSAEESRRLTQQLASQRVDGLITVAPLGDSGGPPGLPTVSVDAPRVRKNAVLLNLEGAGHEATSHLAGHGHRRIALVTASLSSPNNAEAMRGYRRALRETGRRLDEALILEVPAYLREFGYQAGMRLLALKRPPTAIFASGDVLALGVIEAVRAAGKSVPEDIAVASKDNIEFAGLIDPPLTTVSFPTFELGRESMTMLQAAMEHAGPLPRRMLPEARLIIRRSCGCKGERR